MITRLIVGLVQLFGVCLCEHCYREYREGVLHFVCERCDRAVRAIERDPHWQPSGTLPTTVTRPPLPKREKVTPMRRAR